MKKIERKWPIGTADNEVVIKETDLDALELDVEVLNCGIRERDEIAKILKQQRDEAIELLNFLYENIENVYVVESAITNYIQKAGIE